MSPGDMSVIHLVDLQDANDGPIGYTLVGADQPFLQGSAFWLDQAATRGGKRLVNFGPDERRARELVTGLQKIRGLKKDDLLAIWPHVLVLPLRLKQSTTGRAVFMQQMAAHFGLATANLNPVWVNGIDTRVIDVTRCFVIPWSSRAGRDFVTNRFVGTPCSLLSHQRPPASLNWLVTELRELARWQLIRVRPYGISLRLDTTNLPLEKRNREWERLELPVLGVLTKHFGVKDMDILRES